MQNGAGAEKSDTRNDLGSDSSRISAEQLRDLR